MFGKKKSRDEHETPEIHRDGELDEEGVSQVVIEQFVHVRLPQLLQIKEEMDAGKPLTEGELELMTRLIERGRNINRFVYKHPQFEELVAKIIDLAHDILEEALSNEANSQDRQGGKE